MPDQPNIIFVMPDQLRADFLSSYGASFDTPSIDALAHHGVLFRRGYSAHPVCVPARVSLITGMNAIKNGVTDNGQFLRPDYRACGIQTWPEILNDAGYHTVAVGKMHFYPWEVSLGFQERIIAEDKIWIHILDDYQRFLHERGYAKSIGHERQVYHENFGAFVSDIPWEYSVDHFVGCQSVEWIRRHAGEGPFAMMVGFPGPHSPYDPSPEFLDGLEPEEMPEPIPAVAEDMARLRRPGRRFDTARPWHSFRRESGPTREHYLMHRAYYAALVRQIDHEMGCIVQALAEQGILENTVIIFSSDHGDYLGDHNLSGKGTFFETAMRVPLIVRLPGPVTPRVSDDLVTLTDVTATIVRLAGCEVPAHMDSVPLPSLGIDGEGQRETVVGMLTRKWMYYDGEWKLHKYAGGGSLLFNLAKDPTEQHNRIDDPSCHDVLQRLDALLTEEIMNSIDLSHLDKRVYVVDSLSSSKDFGRTGWQRRYPFAIQ